MKFSPPSFKPSMAVTKTVRISSSSGAEKLTFDIHIWPLIPGSFNVRVWSLEIGRGT